MSLKVAREDEFFMRFQKKVYDDFNEKTRLECKMAEKIFDYDLKDHLAQLEHHNIKDNDFQPFPMKDCQLDLVGDLMYRYLQDIKHRQKSGEFGRATAATLLRKCTKLEDIEIMIEDLQRKSDDLLSNAEKIAAKLAKEARQKEIDETITKLTSKKLEFKSKNMGVRKASFHGKVKKPLFEGFDIDFWQEQVGILPTKGRCGSAKMRRTGLNREITLGKKKV